MMVSIFDDILYHYYLAYRSFFIVVVYHNLKAPKIYALFRNRNTVIYPSLTTTQILGIPIPHPPPPSPIYNSPLSSHPLTLSTPPPHPLNPLHLSIP